jgi:hypothetical protein
MDGDLFRNDASPAGIDNDHFRIGADLFVIVDKEALCLGHFVGASD